MEHRPCCQGISYETSILGFSILISSAESQLRPAYTMKHPDERYLLDMSSKRRVSKVGEAKKVYEHRASEPLKVIFHRYTLRWEEQRAIRPICGDFFPIHWCHWHCHVTNGGGLKIRWHEFRCTTDKDIRHICTTLLCPRSKLVI